ncbi:MAG: hypothetical protein HMLKMBBP_01403 [Planctomycetes bacterium]|nr:hypothetical protein [Planctomycetota bacterium]
MAAARPKVEPLTDADLSEDLTGAVDAAGRRTGWWSTPQGPDGATMSVPFVEGRAHGVSVVRRADGAPVAEWTWVEGVAHGPHRIWHATSRLAEDHTFENGFMAGVSRSFDEEGRLFAEREMQAGLAHGKERLYLPDGTLFGVREYANGLPHGRDVMFDGQGRTTHERTHFHGTPDGDERLGPLRATWRHGALIRSDFRFIDEVGAPAPTPFLRILFAAFVVAVLAWHTPGLTATLLGIGAAIWIHEAGHAAAARRAGIPVAFLRVGFGPLVARWMRGNRVTELRLVPIFGFVAPTQVRPSAMPLVSAAIRGEPEPRGVRVDPDEAPEPASERAPPLRRLTYELGGVAANLLTAFVARWLSHDPGDPVAAAAWCGRMALRMLAAVPAALASLFDFSAWVGGQDGLLAAGDAEVTSFGIAVQMFGVVSLILFSFNLAPIPPLDGYRALLSLFEAATGRRPPEAATKWMQRIGVALFALLAVGGLWHMGRDLFNVLTK